MREIVQRLLLSGGEHLAFRHLPGRVPGVMFLPGYASDMAGTKARALAAWAERTGRALVLFDYRGHGASDGVFTDHVLSDWLADVLAMLDHGPLAGPVVLVGSSMGGWLMVLAALRRPERVRGLVGVAAAPDFTRRVEASLSEQERRELTRLGHVRRPSRYGEPLPLTAALLADGHGLCVLDGPIPFNGPVHLLHGRADPDVPWACSARLAAALTSRAVTLELVDDGDHRLSRPEDLRRLTAAVERVLGQVEAGEGRG
jgi:pimeloyl-ACP methyl ester carboxylesterase